MVVVVKVVQLGRVTVASLHGVVMVVGEIQTLAPPQVQLVVEAARTLGEETLWQKATTMMQPHCLLPSKKQLHVLQTKEQHLQQQQLNLQPWEWRAFQRQIQSHRSWASPHSLTEKVSRVQKWA